MLPRLVNCCLPAIPTAFPMGCVGLRPIEPQGCCEMKRLYVSEHHRSREFIEFLKLFDAAYPADTAIGSFSTTIRPMSRARPRAGSPRSPLAALPSRSAWVMAQSHRGLLLQAGAFGAAPHSRQFQTRTQGTPDGLHRRHQSRASRPHLALQNRQCSMIRIGTLFWKHHTRAVR